MIEIRETAVFSKWLESLRDSIARTRIQARILRLRHGNPGDVKPVGNGISEIRIDHGPGYRVYFIQEGQEFVVLLAGGDKRTQQRDIEKAIELAKHL